MTSSGILLVEVSNVDHHEFCPAGGHNAVEEYFSNEHFGRRGSYLAGVVDAVSTHCEARPILLFLFVAHLAEEGAVGDISLSASRHVGFANKLDCIRAFDAPANAVGQPPVFVC